MTQTDAKQIFDECLKTFESRQEGYKDTFAAMPDVLNAVFDRKTPTDATEWCISMALLKIKRYANAPSSCETTDDCFIDAINYLAMGLYALRSQRLETDGAWDNGWLLAEDDGGASDFWQAATMQD